MTSAATIVTTAASRRRQKRLRLFSSSLSPLVRVLLLATAGAAYIAIMICGGRSSSSFFCDGFVVTTTSTPTTITRTSSTRLYYYMSRNATTEEAPTTTMMASTSSSTSMETTAAPSTTTTTETTTSDPTSNLQTRKNAAWTRFSESDAFLKLSQAIGTIDESRYVLPEYKNGELPRLYSSLTFAEEEEVDDITIATTSTTPKHRVGNVYTAAALVAGTTIGAGILGLPAATVEAGFLPSSFAMIIGYGYMLMSGLLIAELSINRMGTTGKINTGGVLDLFKSQLPSTNLANLGTAAYFFLHYAVMVAYIAQGGMNLNNMLPAGNNVDGIGQLAFAGTLLAGLYGASKSMIETFNNTLVGGVFVSFAAILGLGVQTAHFETLLQNNHPEHIVDCFPVIFLAFVYQNIVPTIVQDLEGDRTKIVKSILLGTTAPLFMFLAWNAVILANIPIDSMTAGGFDPVALLQSSTGNGMLGTLVSAFSSLALVTSMIGFVYGLMDAWADVLKLGNDDDTKKEQYRLPLLGLAFAPPLLLSLANPDIFQTALEYGGAFGVSTLFLVLPPIMVWKERYADSGKLVTQPLVPLGKIPLGSMWKAAGTLIVEQGAEKLGVFDALMNFVEQNHLF